MHNVWVIIKREYLERVRTKAFWIMTLLVPAFMAGITILPSKLALSQRGADKKIAIVASDAAFAEAVRRGLERTATDMGRGKYAAEVVLPGTPEQQAQLKERVLKGELDGYLLATDAALAEKKLVYSARTTTDLLEGGVLNAAVKIAHLQKALAGYGLESEKVEALLRERIEVDMVRIAPGKETRTSGRAAFFSAFFLVMTLYMSIILYGVSVMRSVLEEKSSRIVEVLLAAVTPKELMAGKILGVGAVGLTQLVIWYGAGAILALPMAVQVRALAGNIELPMTAIAFFPVFFVLGYFLYATLWAMLGAMVNSEQEAQQMQFVVMLPLILATVLIAPAILNPNSPLIVAASLFPFCTPLLMYVRMVVQQPPLWQILLSVVLMLGALWLVLVVASRIYRVGILMYGKRPTLPELVRWFKYA